MRLLLKIVAAVLVIVVALVGLAVWSPVTASRLVWPVVERAMLADPFHGVTADGAIERGLFRIEATGVSTAPLVEAAHEFLSSLTADQRGRTLYPADDLEWRRWANIHISTRQGVGLLEMDARQTEAAFGLMAATLSARGFETSRDIMRLEGHLADLMDDHTQYGEQRYWFTVMGEPSEAEPWGWQLDGHHLSVNCFVLGDQVVLTPTFMGSEPVRAETGGFAGTVILEEELAAGLALVNALDDAQRALAIVSSDKTANSNRGELFQGQRGGAVPGSAARRAKRRATPARAPAHRVVHGQPTRRPCGRPARRDRAALGGHLFCLDRWHRSERSLLLPHPLTDGDDRIRPPDAGCVGWSRTSRAGSTCIPWCAPRTAMTMARTCSGSTCSSTRIERRNPSKGTRGKRSGSADCRV